ncbi:E3 ubiquitin-protein ligase TRIM35-like [Nelusetta ayraudi]|uniref:E3 ubiquitin-protein ligase TRIM35-like n=1 Tax=Nelusetta ayraudi TaxID=303726 RepID=UPI003F6F21AC
MEEKIALFRTFLNCPVCLDTFTDPVSLDCNHSFCFECLQNFWERNTLKSCPICKRNSTRDFLMVNMALKQVADYVADYDADREKSGSSETEEDVKVRLAPGNKEKKMWSEEEQKAGCAVCEGSRHQDHKLALVEEAFTGLKERLKSDLKALKDKKEKYGDVELKYREIIQHVEKQVLFTEKRIRAEFNKLRLFLREEEESRLAALREEEDHKRKVVTSEMEKIQEEMSSLSRSIAAVEQELQQEDAVAGNPSQGLQSRARDQCSQSDPEMVPGVLIDVAKHLGNLSFSVWKKMKKQVHFSPVILDPITANRWLQLSDDLTSVRRGETPQQLPDNPERNTGYCSVLGSEGFSSGQHSWEVEVGDGPRWNVGVAKESADWRAERRDTPEHGIWCLIHKHGKYTSGCDEAIAVEKSLQRIRVQLDLDRGKVSFFDAVDVTHIYTYVNVFAEKLRPYVFVGEAGDH